ncbi:hypothetical protein R1X32_11085 (plasmid) [Rhodococcus opacus]|uniref:hypothetical protein n=1 Tax=Rhodococcus opacus TaxID=37919 RepID=UPI0034D17E97
MRVDALLKSANPTSQHRGVGWMHSLIYWKVAAMFCGGGEHPEKRQVGNGIAINGFSTLLPEQALRTLIVPQVLETGRTVCHWNTQSHNLRTNLDQA